MTMGSQEFGVLENFRIRVLPVLGTMPAIFGQSAAAFVLCELAGKPFVPCAVDGLSRAVKHRMLQVGEPRGRERPATVFQFNRASSITWTAPVSGRPGETINMSGAACLCF
jgi:hypothetical protein